MSAVALSYGGSSTQEPHPVLSTNKAVAAGLAAVPFQHVVVPAVGEVSPTAPAMPAPAQSFRPNSEVPAARPAAAVVENSAPFSISCHNVSGDSEKECKVASTGGFAGVVEFSCAGLPDQLGCLFDPPSASVAPGSKALTRLSITIGPRLRRGLTTFQVVASHGGFQAQHSISWDVGSQADPRGSYNLRCGGTVTILAGESGVVACTVESHGGFKGPVTLDCEAFDGLICNEGAATVILEEYQDVPVKFYVEVPAGAYPSEYILHVHHDGDMRYKFPVPYAFLVNVPNTLPPCETVLPLNCYMDPSRLVPTQP
jgi:hypothetical protein